MKRNGCAMGNAARIFIRDHAKSVSGKKNAVHTDSVDVNAVPQKKEEI